MEKWNIRQFHVKREKKVIITGHKSNINYNHIPMGWLIQERQKKTRRNIDSSDHSTNKNKRSRLPSRWKKRITNNKSINVLHKTPTESSRNHGHFIILLLSSSAAIFSTSVHLCAHMHALSHSFWFLSRRFINCLRKADSIPICRPCHGTPVCFVYAMEAFSRSFDICWSVENWPLCVCYTNIGCIKWIDRCASKQNGKTTTNPLNNFEIVFLLKTEWSSWTIMISLCHFAYACNEKWYIVLKIVHQLTLEMGVAFIHRTVYTDCDFVRNRFVFAITFIWSDE